MQAKDTSTSETYKFNGRESIGKAFLEKNVPREAIEILLNSLSVATIKQYETSLKMWWSFCNGSKETFFKPSVKKVLRFLTQNFNKGASFSTLNTHRSAIALISGNSIGKNKIICRFLKGVYNIRPARPRYDFTWDVSIVLSYLEKLYSLETLSFTQLTEKTVTLLALCTAHRAQTLANIKITNILKTNNNIQIRIENKIKTSGPGRYQPILILPVFKENPSLCIASIIIKYLKVTKTLRGSEQNLLIATKKPHKGVGAQTLGRWIKKTLQNSGIDTTIFQSSFCKTCIYFGSF